jgi:hypothetical protein
VGTFVVDVVGLVEFHFVFEVLVFADKMPNFCLFWCQIVEKIKKNMLKNTFFNQNICGFQKNALPLCRI